MLMRLAGIISVVSLVACVSPAQQARQQATVTAERQAWWPMQFADENQCRMQGPPEGTDAFAQCVTMKLDQQSRPHRGAGRGWLILNKF
jgi:uncharacterized membrane protein